MQGAINKAANGSVICASGVLGCGSVVNKTGLTIQGGIFDCGGTNEAGLSIKVPLASSVTLTGMVFANGANGAIVVSESSLPSSRDPSPSCQTNCEFCVERDTGAGQCYGYW